MLSLKKPRKLGFCFCAGGSPAASSFIFLAQNKGTKQKGTPCRGPSDSLALLAKPGGGLNSG